MDNLKWNIGKLNKGKHLPIKVKEKISKSIKRGYKYGRKVWNDGKSLSEETKKKISSSKKGSKPWNVGIPRTLQEREKISLAKKGKPAWNKGKKRTSEEKRKMSLGAKLMWKRRTQKTKKLIND